MVPRASARRAAAFTLIELMVVIAVIASAIALGAPGIRQYILTNRLKSTTAQITTDLHLLRSEAASRNVPAYFGWTQVPALQYSCYVLFLSSGGRCECRNGAGAACASPTTQTEIRTVRLLHADKIRMSVYMPPGKPGDSPYTNEFGYDNLTGAVAFNTTDFVPPTAEPFGLEVSISGDAANYKLRIVVSNGGSVSVCSSGSKIISGYPRC